MVENDEDDPRAASSFTVNVDLVELVVAAQ